MKRTFFAVLLLIVIAPLSRTAAAQDWAKASLEKSPRHREWVKIKHDNREVQAFVVYPERKDKAPVVLVIHEIFGMTDWVQSLTDQLAAAGYIAIAPDLLSGMGPNGGGTSSITDPQGVGKAIRDLPPDQITADLNAAADYAKKLPASNGKLAVTGYCWGGSQSFRYATNRPDLNAAFVFYGTSPENVSTIKAPVYGFYAGNDARVNATIPATEQAMKAAGKKFEPVTYEGAGHGFMRAGEAPEPPADATEQQKANYAANKKARSDAWERWLGILKSM
jgi:carboxymethylenebutenolidase